jgi:gamma-glutamyltranspeptidase/glutathione hydrolase
MAIDAGRWVLHGPITGFDTWTTPEGPHVLIEGQAPDHWRTELAQRGHDVRVLPPFDSTFGHAHAIVVDAQTGMLVGAADPRTRVGSVAGM